MTSPSTVIALAIALAGGGVAARPLEAELPDMMTCWEATLDAAELANDPRRQVSRIMLVHYPEDWKPDAEGRFEVMLKARFRDRVDDPDDEDGFDHSIMGRCGADGDALQCRAVGQRGLWRIERSAGALTLRTIEPITLERDIGGAPRTLSPETDPQWRLGRTSYGACQI